MNLNKDYYYILGVSQEADNSEIKKAYRKLSQKFHPDMNGGDKFFEDRFKEIQEAYEILSNSHKRAIYDEERKVKSNQSSYSEPQENYFVPVIESFTANKKEVAFDEEITFYWKCLNCDVVMLKPFGQVKPIGSKTIKSKVFDKESFSFELVASNSTITKSTFKNIIIENKTYKAIKNEILKKEENKKNEDYVETKTVTDNRTGYVIVISVILLLFFLSLMLS
ncbi:J domain-containing protein [Flammeovirga kamogawensis]|uniref:DnaJ domain-containing protein n=1 Tax=Flammeovirga kamogawensis TaxID=373891 RepID=A0ABX8H0Z8_9BACT|nr:J domain-containing protein [Flammeovirga kamogawensis]MBB6462393.1 curved DNA-binding protein CbpA [Flammeovirga kamogawensis]QWG09506.1 DnaJ domain-containing protein [Flammeovirga kamogawensis]TRX65022.1 molecular chaperone DnaJ [Flammeovirga kamogawensis]